MDRKDRRDVAQDETMKQIEETLALTQSSLKKSRQNAAANNNIRKRIELESMMKSQTDEATIDQDDFQELDQELQTIKNELEEFKQQVKIELGDIKNTVKFSGGTRPQSGASGNHLAIGKQDTDASNKEKDFQQFQENV